MPEKASIPPLADIQKDIVQALKLSAADVVAVEQAPSDPCLVVKAEKIYDVLKYLRDETKYEFNFLQVISGADFVAAAATEDVAEVKERMEVLYVVYSFILRSYLNLKVVLPRENPSVDTVCTLFRCANWYEREIFDILGINFNGHPHLERILLPPDWVGHPLRKDYKFPEEYNGMKVPL